MHEFTWYMSVHTHLSGGDLYIEESRCGAGRYRWSSTAGFCLDMWYSLMWWLLYMEALLYMGVLRGEFLLVTNNGDLVEEL